MDGTLSKIYHIGEFARIQCVLRKWSLLAGQPSQSFLMPALSCSPIPLKPRVLSPTSSLSHHPTRTRVGSTGAGRRTSPWGRHEGRGCAGQDGGGPGAWIAPCSPHTVKPRLSWSHLTRGCPTRGWALWHPTRGWHIWAKQRGRGRRRAIYVQTYRWGQLRAVSTAIS